jgi:hypothetical protein
MTSGSATPHRQKVKFPINPQNPNLLKGISSAFL